MSRVRHRGLYVDRKAEKSCKTSQNESGCIDLTYMYIVISFRKEGQESLKIGRPVAPREYFRPKPPDGHQKRKAAPKMMEASAT